MTSVEWIKNKLKFMDHPGACVLIAYTIELVERSKYILVVHNGNPHDCLITNAAVQDHLRNHYGFNSSFAISPVFNGLGLARELEEDNNPHGIEIPYFSTYIYELE